MIENPSDQFEAYLEEANNIAMGFANRLDIDAGIMISAAINILSDTIKHAIWEQTDEISRLANAIEQMNNETNP